MKKTDATLVWCSTTPVPAGKLNASRKTEDAIAYNSIARSIMVEEGIMIDDLYTFALPRLEELQRDQNVHFTTEGSSALAEQVAESIETALEERR